MLKSSGELASLLLSMFIFVLCNSISVFSVTQLVCDVWMVMCMGKNGTRNQHCQYPWETDTFNMAR